MLADDDPRKALVSKDLITYVADRKGHDRRYAIAPDKIKEMCIRDRPLPSVSTISVPLRRYSLLIEVISISPLADGFTLRAISTTSLS